MAFALAATSCDAPANTGALILPPSQSGPFAGGVSSPYSGEGSALGDFVSNTGVMDWNRYYSSGETNRILEEYAELFPTLISLETIGQSLQGRPLVVATVTNTQTGPASEKPALYVDGGIHAGELTGSSVALHVLGTLLTDYGSDPRITALLDTRAFYIRPKFNPDGADLALLEDQGLRSSVRLWDEDGDGRADEDPPNDLNLDRRITRMRVENPDGQWQADPNEPRIMIPRPPAATVGPFYDVMAEGIDDDGDGRLNEDGIGGLDLNRNFPRNWEPEPLQGGAGPFPLSEPETYAAVRFLVDHPNVGGIVHGHTAGGFVYRLPSASDPTRFPATDLNLILDLGAEYTRTTGRPVDPSATDPVDHRYGTLISWGYWSQGIIGWVPEYSPPGAWLEDFDGDGVITEQEELRFDDERLGGNYFTEWTRVDHPEYASVEVGGWWSRFWGQNPPAEFLENETSLQLPWIFFLAERLPQIEAQPPTVRALGGDRYQIRLTVQNTGWLPTSGTERGAIANTRDALRQQGVDVPAQGGTGGATPTTIAPSPYVSLTLSGATLEEGEARTRIGHLNGTNPHIRSLSSNQAVLTWTVSAPTEGAAARIVVVSHRGGTVRLEPVVIR